MPLLFERSNTMQDHKVFQGFVANLSSYQKGKLQGEWVDFPTTQKRMAQVFSNLDTKDQDNVFIAEYKSKENQGLVAYLKPFTKLDEVNFFANMIRNLNENTRQVALTIMDLEGLEDINQCINVIYNLDKYALIPEVTTSKQLAAYKKIHPDSPSAKKHVGDFCDIGYVYQIGKIEIIYDGNVNRIPKKLKIVPMFEPFRQNNLPKEIQARIKDTLSHVEEKDEFQAYIANKNALQLGEIKGEWVAFPTDMETIQVVFERIELSSPFDYVCLGVQSDVKGLNERIDETIHLDVLNYMAEEIESLAYRNDETFEIFESCVEVFDTANSYDILNMLENTDCYRLAQNQHTMQDVANKYMGDLKLPKALSKHIHIDIQGANDEVKPSEAAYFTKNGFLERLRLPTQYYTSHEDVPESSRIFPVLKEINKEDVKKSIVATLENAKSNKEPTKSSKSVKRDVER